MLSFFTKKSGAANTTTTPPPLDSALVGLVLKQFPFGAVVRYYPEFKKNIVLESVLLGYIFDKTWYFAAQDIVVVGEGGNTEILAGTQRKPVRPSSISIVIPAQSRGIDQLDYARKEELERTGGLANGNNITLLGQSYQGKTPIIETVVSKSTIVKEGFYAATPVALLGVNVHSLQLTDQRAHMRLQTRLPAQFILNKGPPTPCIMADFSHQSIRLSVDASWTGTIKVGREITLSFNLPGRSDEVALRGEILRRDDNGIVVMLEAIQHGDQFQRIEIIDILEIKAKLLQLPETTV